MILIDVVDAALAIWDALVITIVVVAFVGTVVLLSGLALGTWAVKRVWRIARAAWTTTGPRTDSLAPLAAEQPASDSSPTTTPQRRTQPHEPSWARTDKEAA